MSTEKNENVVEAKVRIHVGGKRYLFGTLIRSKADCATVLTSQGRRSQVIQTDRSNVV